MRDADVLRLLDEVLAATSLEEAKRIASRWQWQLLEQLRPGLTERLQEPATGPLMTADEAKQALFDAAVRNLEKVAKDAGVTWPGHGAEI
jgi:hypothetical protein